MLTFPELLPASTFLRLPRASSTVWAVSFFLGLSGDGLCCFQQQNDMDNMPPLVAYPVFISISLINRTLILLGITICLVKYSFSHPPLHDPAPANKTSQGHWWSFLQTLKVTACWGLRLSLSLSVLAGMQTWWSEVVLPFYNSEVESHRLRKTERE